VGIYLRSNRQKEFLSNGALQIDMNRFLAAGVSIAMALLSHVIETRSTLAQISSTAAWKNCQSGDVEARLTGCTAIIKSNGFGSKSRLSDALDGRCWALHMKGQFALAIDDCKASIRLRPKYSYAYNNLGAAYLGIGDYRSALGALNAAIELKPDYYWSRVNRAKALSAIGDKTGASGDYEYLLVRDPANQEIRNALNELENGSANTTSTSTGSGATTIANSRRIALVIGNSAYKSVAALPNAYRDAEAIAAGLQRTGFQEVTVQINLGHDKFTDTLRNFARQADAADWAVVYYAGHGIEMGGINYLIPVDAKLEVDRDVEFEAIPLDRVMAAVDGAKKLRLVILDACRNNPFLGQMRRTIATRSIGRGLAPVEPEAGSLVVYSAKHGEIALDGEGTNSPFASAFIKNLATPGLEVRRLFDVVRDDVMASTNGRQQPFSYGSLPGSEDFFFAVK
jgi:tetratricopeptide (TPR) repeat protein